MQEPFEVLSCMFTPLKYLIYLVVTMNKTFFIHFVVIKKFTKLCAFVSIIPLAFRWQITRMNINSADKNQKRSLKKSITLMEHSTAASQTRTL